MEDEGAVVEEGVAPVQSPLVAVTFQRNVHRKEKYLEAEPRALGITQICLSVYTITCVSVLQAKGLSHLSVDIPLLIFSLLVLIAGSVAVAAQNLHLPTLRACMGMEIVACGSSIINLIFTVIKMEDMPFYCWNHFSENDTNNFNKICQELEATHSHLYAGEILAQAALLAISVTLTAYCCKVINCCGPAPKMPVITIQAPPPPTKQTSAED